MAIEENLRKIQEARYGREVRGAIHDAIHDCYEDGRAGTTDLIAREQIAAERTARETAVAGAMSAITAEQAARTAAVTAEENARTAAVAAEQAAREAAVANLESIKADKTQLASPFNFKGSCLFAELPTSGNEVNDTYYVTDMTSRYSWNGTAWYQSGMSEADYTDALAAVETAVQNLEDGAPGTITGELKEDLYSLRIEHFPIAVEWENGYLKNDGSVEGSPTYKTSRLIEIPSGYRLVFNSYASTSTYHYANYAEDGSFESVGFGNTGLLGRNGIKVDAIEKRWVRICTNTAEISTENANVHLEKLPSEKVGIEDISNVLPASGVTFVKGYLSSSSHGRTDSEVYYCTSQIFVQKGQTIEYKCSGSSGALMLMEITRASAYVASLVTGDSDYHRLAYTADHDMWVRICTRTAKGGNYVPLEEFKDIKLYYKPLLHKSEKLNGKKIVVIGDSLIHGNKLGTDVTWTKLLANDTGASVFNYGINGNAISSVSGATGSPISVRYATIPEISDADIIIVEGGANDKNQNCPIGGASDTTNNTFIGACNVLIDGLRAVNPTSHILFMTTYHRYPTANTLGKYEKDYADAMMLACGYKAVPCYNNCMDSGLTFLDSNLKSWCDEGLYIESATNQHFSPKGYEYLYPKYKAWIESQL